METNKIKYTITFLSDWHIGSGLGSGADADSTVLKDKNDFPYVPGKTIKGLLKDALLDISELQPGHAPRDLIDEIFGYQSDTLENARSHQGTVFFSNATVAMEEQNIINNDMKPFLYRQFASTKINKNGIAEQGSLRTIEVTIPMIVEGYISGEFTTDKQVLIEKGFKLIRSIGTLRNRGLGRCKIELENHD